MKRRILVAAVNVAGIIGLVVVSVAAGRHFAHQGNSVPSPFKATAPPPPLSYLGVYEPSSPHSYSGVAGFGEMIGRSPNLALYYSSWWEPFQLSFARAAQAHRAIPMVQVEPRDIKLSAIASGVYNHYLRRFARAVRSYGGPVVFSFGHEMNANWYGWGYQHTSPATFIAAWRHIHQVFAGQGARNVIWLWTVNVVGGPNARPISPWWPGSSYVTWVGIDGHYFTPTIRFASLFGGTLGQVHQLTSDPVLISEAGIAPFVNANRINDLFAGAWTHRLLGVVWFDVPGHNLRVEGNQPAIAEFRQVTHKYFENSRDPGLYIGPRRRDGPDYPRENP